jgi:hypothetical protein
MFRRVQLLTRSWNQDTPPDERFTEKYGDRVLVGQRRSNAFPDAYAQLATAAAAATSRRTLPKTCGDDAKGRPSESELEPSQEFVSDRNRLCLHLFYALHQRHHRLLFPSTKPRSSLAIDTRSFLVW